MSNTNTGGPAFPFEYHNQTSRHQPGFFGTSELSPGASQQFAGMTLRDYFAAKAMQAEMAQGIHESDFDWMVARCYKVADAMLAARSQA